MSDEKFAARGEVVENDLGLSGSNKSCQQTRQKKSFPMMRQRNYMICAAVSWKNGLIEQEQGM
jgi:hypothetical protein